MAPISAACTIASPSTPLITELGTIPLAIVAATLIEMNAPTKLSVPDMTTATLGFSAPVAIDVAIALAVSWKPLVKSNATATTITMTRTNVEPMRGTLPQRRPARCQQAVNILMLATACPAGAAHSVALNSQIAMPSMTSPRITITAASSSVGTRQPNQVTPESSACSAWRGMLRWLNTALRIGSTA